MGRYASTTNVSVEKSQMEIRSVLAKYGAEGFLLGEQGSEAMVQFAYKKRTVRFMVQLPDFEKFRTTPSKGLVRDSDTTRKHWEQGCRQKWRALLLFIKASLEAVDEEITDFDTVFLPYLVLPSKRTVGEEMAPIIHDAIRDKKMPQLALLAPPK